jgi:putative acetyltransferase
MSSWVTVQMTTRAELSVRKEYPPDISAIRELLVASFPTPVEADLVDALRAAGRLSISLVAVDGGAVVGHIGFSPITVEGTTLGLGLAPLVVRADRRRHGVGERLVRDGLALCRNLAVGLVVVLGDPRYYRRFGFEPARRLELRSEYEEAGDAFQGVELVPGTLRPGGGLVRYCSEFAHVA